MRLAYLLMKQGGGKLTADSTSIISREAQSAGDGSGDPDVSGLPEASPTVLGRAQTTSGGAGETDPSNPTDPSEPATTPSGPETTDPSEPATTPSDPATDPSKPATTPSDPAVKQSLRHQPQSLAALQPQHLA